jgi:hypothetical protein
MLIIASVWWQLCYRFLERGGRTAMVIIAFVCLHRFKTKVNC